MPVERFNIYTIKGRAILERGKKEIYLVDDDGMPIQGMTYSIDLSNEFERMQLLKNEDDIEKDDTALFYQIREVLSEAPYKCKDVHSDANCLKDKIFIVDFENLFMEIAGLEKNKLIQYWKEVFEIQGKRRKELEELTWMYGEVYSEHEWSVNEKYPMPKLPKFGQNEMIHMLFEKGIKVIFDGKEKHFVPFDKSQSMARHSKITFIDGTLRSKINERLMLGCDTAGPFYLSKFYAYKGLFLSSGQRILSSDIELNEETVIVLPDGPIYPGDNKDTKGVKVLNVSYITNEDTLGDKGEVIIGEKKEETISIDSVFDGEGIISRDYALKLNRELFSEDKVNEVTSFQIRMPYIKGMVHYVDIQAFLDEFCGEKEIILITDCFGIQRDLRKAKMIITQSMYKAYIGEMSDWFTSKEEQCDPMQKYFERFRKYKHALYISGTNLPYKNRKITTLNYQFLNTLKLTEEELSALIDKHMFYVEQPIEYLKRNTYTYSNNKIDDDESKKQETVDGDNDEETENESRESESSEEVYDDEKIKTEVPGWITVLLNNPDSIHNPYIKEKVEALKKSLIKDIGYGRILVEGEVRYLSRDILYFLQIILKHIDIKVSEDRMKEISEEVNELKDFFYMPSAKIDLEENHNYQILRSPHLSRNEQCAIRALKPCKESLRHKYLGHLEGIVMVSYDSMVPDTLGGADFDGDIVKVFAADELRNAVLRGVYGMENAYEVNEMYTRKLPIIRITPLKSKQKKEKVGGSFFNLDAYMDINYVTIFNTFANKVGKISNMAIRIGRQQYWTEEQNNKKNICCEMCTILTGLEIDACKTGVHPKISSIVQSIEEKQNEYLQSFKPKLDQLRFITWKNFKTNDDATIYSYEVKGDNRIEVEKNSTYILQQLAFEFMKRAANFNESSEDKDKGNYYIFDFEKDAEWESKCDKRKIEDHINLLKAYRYATKLLRNYNKNYLSQNESKWRYKILKIWLNQDAGGKENLAEYGVKYLYILNKIKKYIDKKHSEDYKMEANEMAYLYQKDLIDSEWPYLYNKEDKLEFLANFFDIEIAKLDETLTETLCDFSYRGYHLLYLFLKEVENSFKITFEEAVKRHINKEEFLFEDKSKELEKVHIKEHLDAMLIRVFENNGNAKKCLLGYLREKIGEDSFETMYYVSKNNQSLREYFWEYYGSKDIEDYIKGEGKNA